MTMQCVKWWRIQRSLDPPLRPPPSQGTSMQSSFPPPLSRRSPSPPWRSPWLFFRCSPSPHSRRSPSPPSCSSSFPGASLLVLANYVLASFSWMGLIPFLLILILCLASHSVLVSNATAFLCLVLVYSYSLPMSSLPLCSCIQCYYAPLSIPDLLLFSSCVHPLASLLCLTPICSYSVFVSSLPFMCPMPPHSCV